MFRFKTLDMLQLLGDKITSHNSDDHARKTLTHMCSSSNS